MSSQLKTIHEVEDQNRIKYLQEMIDEVTKYQSARKDVFRFDAKIPSKIIPISSSEKDQDIISKNED